MSLPESFSVPIAYLLFQRSEAQQMILGLHRSDTATLTVNIFI
jgi:hypothetical protein